MPSRPNLRARLLADTHAAMQAVNMAQSVEALDDAVGAILRRYGARSHLIGVVPTTPIPLNEQAALVLSGRWPTEWAERYFAMRYVEADPVIRHVRTRTAPSTWDDIVRSRGRFLVMDEAMEFGLGSGLTLPQLTLDGVRIAVSFAGERIDDGPEARTAMVFLAATATARNLELARRREAASAVELSARERECLHWLVEGKTDWEIGMILGITRRTVVKHLDGVRTKLGVATRTQIAVAALRAGLLD